MNMKLLNFDGIILLQASDLHFKLYLGKNINA